MNHEFEKVKDLVAKDDLAKALYLLKEQLTENKHIEYLIHQSARYYELEKALQIGIIEWEKVVTGKAKIRKALLDLIKSLLDELEAEDNEEQKFVFDSEGKKRPFIQGSFKQTTSLEIKENTDLDISVPTQDFNLEGLVLRFLTVYDRWYFSPLRIQRFGGRQGGFEELKKHSSKEITKVLLKLLRDRKIKTTKSKKGNPIYKIR